jgi:hypothetical protein
MATKYSYDSKPMIIGEFPASGWAGDTYRSNFAAKTEITTEECYRKAFDGGYAGALAWQYIGDKTEANFGGYSYTIDPALKAMTALAAKEEASIKIKDVNIEGGSGGNGMMAVTYGADNAQVEYQNKGGWDLSGATTFTWTAKNNGTSDADLYLIFKLTDSWTWTETDGSCKVPAGEKVTCSIDISSFADRNKTLSITLANYASGYTGTVIYDDIKAGDLTLFDFNTDKYDAFKRGYENTEEMIPEIKIVFDENYVFGKTGLAKATGAASSKFTINGDKIMLNTKAQGNVSVDVFSMNGKRVATLFSGKLSAGSYVFSLADMPKGQYIVRMKAGSTTTQPVIVK